MNTLLKKSEGKCKVDLYVPIKKDYLKLTCELLQFLILISIVLFIGVAAFATDVWALSVFLLPILLVIFLIKQIFMPFLEFGIIDDFNIRKEYSYYAPKEYNCTSVDGDLINNLSESLKIIKSYFHSYDSLEIGLAYFGITIIPPESFSLFYDVGVSSPNFNRSNELTDLAANSC